MTTVNYTGLSLAGALSIERLTALELHVGVNEHGWAVVEGEAGKDALEQLQGAVAGREQVILVQDETGAEQPLFSGIIRTAGLITYGGYNRFHIELQSGTIQMDQVKRSRSFQNVGQTYSEVAQRVASGCENGAVIPTVGLDKPLGVPVIQYRETDWEFLKRMASWCGGVVVPETHYAYPRIWFGFPERSFTCTFPEDCYTSGISQRYYELGGPASGFQRSDFFYYDVPSSQLCDLGWYTVFRGQEFLICEKWAKLERGELVFTYRLGKPGLVYGRKQYNDKISGMTILGEVLSTERETVCLKLDIDKGWNPGGPYPYTWRPETGNMMYCMPQVGTRVSLYFPNYDEQTAMAVNCVRTNGSSCAQMSDPSKRSFVTEHGKEMNLYPTELSFMGGATGMVKLADMEGIFFKSDKKITIVAKASVSIIAKKAVTSAPIGEIVLIKGNLITGEVETSLVQSNRYDFLAADFTHMEGWVHISYSAYGDQLEEVEISGLELALHIIGAVAVVAVVGFLIAPFVLGGMVIGAITGAIHGGMVALEQKDDILAMLLGGAFFGAIQGGIKGGEIGIDVASFLCPSPIKNLAVQLVDVPFWELALTNMLPDILANFDKDGFTTWVQENIPKWIVRDVVDVIARNKIVTLTTQYGLADELFSIAGFERDDDDGTYHARIDAWQKYFGYNDMYDFFFDYGTDMRYGKFSFEYEGENYIFWAWKGDYLNLGAGTELGIYKQFEDSDHYVVDISLPMTLHLKDENEEPIADYTPDEDQWWITAFNPEYPNVNAERLRATFYVDLSGDPDMYDIIKEQFQNKEEEYPEYKDWTYDDTNCILTLHF